MNNFRKYSGGKSSHSTITNMASDVLSKTCLMVLFVGLMNYLSNQFPTKSTESVIKKNNSHRITNNYPWDFPYPPMKQYELVETIDSKNNISLTELTFKILPYVIFMFAYALVQFFSTKKNECCSRKAARCESSEQSSCNIHCENKRTIRIIRVKPRRSKHNSSTDSGSGSDSSSSSNSGSSSESDSRSMSNSFHPTSSESDTECSTCKNRN
jgi:hypothetical protein